MSTSEAECFRTRQALSDLRTLIAAASQETLAGIVPPSAHASMAALLDGTDDDAGRRDDVLTALKTAAALPNDDFEGFVTATMVLLAHTLEHERMADEFDHHWHTFRDHYRAAAAVQRAAIVQAIRRIRLVRGETEDLPVTVPDRATAPTAALRPLIERFRPRGLAPPDPASPPGIAVLLLEAFDDIEAAVVAAGLWADHGARLVETAPRELLAGFRHIYETSDGWAPRTGVMLPVLDPPPGVDWPY